jgi:3-methyladenine DNA glycosylase/8-oxoguanine DNA glycosylase
MAAERLLLVPAPFDLARTAAPVWWSRGRWPNVDWIDDHLVWVGWECGRVVSRTVRQAGPGVLTIGGSALQKHDAVWARQVLGSHATMPAFQDPVIARLARDHEGLRPWCAGSLYEGVVSSIVGQSISVAAAAMTERRLYALFNPELELIDRPFWPPPRPEQLAAADVSSVRSSGVTTKRAEALIAAAAEFGTRPEPTQDAGLDAMRSLAASLRQISGIGTWTVRSALLWGIADDDAHPTGDVALLRAARRHYPQVTTLKALDQLAECWAPARGWAARLLWADLLGYAGAD